MTSSLASRERVIRALNHQETDRIPIDFGGSSTAGIHRCAHERLAAYIGLTNPQGRMWSMMTQSVIPDPRLREMFGADIILIDPGKPDAWMLQVDHQANAYTDEWGVRMHMPAGCYYYEYADYPLKEGSIEELDRYAWPDPRDPGRYRGLEDRAKDLYENTDKALLINNPFGIWEQTWALRGVENAFTDLAANVSFAEALADRLLEWQKVYWDEMLQRVGRYAHVIKLNDDLGWHEGPLMSLLTYRRVYKPRHKALVEFIRERTEAKIFLHSDGNIYPLLADLAEIGIDILNPVEVTARDMDSARLKAEYGNRFVFWGAGCSNVLLTQGTPQEVEEEVRQRIRDLAPGGGYVFAPIHIIQPNVPPENIVALFQAALKWGRYPIM